MPARNGGNDDGRRNPFERSEARPSRGGASSSDAPTINRKTHWTGDFVPTTTADRPVHSRPSRSGTVNYGTRSNGYGDAHAARYGGGLSRSTLGAQIRRTDARARYRVSYGGVYGGLRVGYVGYNSYWIDDYFCYPFYVFDPWAPNVVCVASPWYRYSYLPPYLSGTRVDVVDGYVSPWNYDGWSDYDYRYQTRDDRNERLSDALDDIKDAFELNSARYGDRVLPVTGQVAIFNDGKYDYSLSADDFQDMFLDGIEQSKTVKYEIIESQVRGNDVRLRARHEYTDSWRQTQVVFHSYTLQREPDGHYVIREFGTD